MSDDARVALVEDIWNDPDAGPELRRLIVKKHPKARAMMPDLIVTDQNDKTLAEIRKERADFEQFIAREKGSKNRQDAHGRLKAAGYSADDIKEIEGIMTDPEAPSANWDAAAALYDKRRVVAAPRPDPLTSRMQVPGVKGAGGEWFKGLVEDPDGWAKDKADQVIHDFRTGNGHLHL